MHTKCATLGQGLGSEPFGSSLVWGKKPQEPCWALSSAASHRQCHSRSGPWLAPGSQGCSCVQENFIAGSWLSLSAFPNTVLPARNSWLHHLDSVKGKKQGLPFEMWQEEGKKLWQGSHRSEVVSEGVPKRFCHSTELLQVPGQCCQVSLALLHTWIQWILISCAACCKGKCLLNVITRDVVS